MDPRLIRVALALLISLGLAFHGYSKKSLSISGCIAAIFVGFSSFSCGYRFGLILILFYYTSSKLTKVDENRKKEIEFEYQTGGQRNWIQVFANSIIATILALTYIYYFSDKDFSLSDVLNDYRSTSSSDASELVNILGLFSIAKSSLKLHLICMYVAHYACASADTWASEVGVLSSSPPRLVTTLFLRKVPPGTNGGMSALGTTASALGGAFIGLIYAVYDAALLPQASLNAPARMVLFGLVAGVLGSLFDSILGATLQASYYAKSKKVIVRTKAECKKIESNDIELICGVDVLSNEAVNVISIIMTCIAMVPLIPYIF